MKRSMQHLALALVAAALVAGSAGAALGGDHAYVGSGKCKMCHLKEYKSWSETKMAKAFDLLKPGVRAEEKKKAGLEADKDYTKDAKCVPCHVTGHGKTGGFKDFESTPDLAGVGCETCHGPGGTYLKPEHMSLKNQEYKKADLVAVGLVGEITEKQCVGCHNAESPFVGKDFVFDFKANAAKGTHEKFPLKYKH